MVTPADEDTVRLPRAAAPRAGSPPPAGGLPTAPRRRRGGAPWLLPAIGGIVLLGGAGGGAYVYLARSPRIEAERPAAPPPPAAPAPRFATATEAEILAHAGPALRVRQLAPNPAILVLDFATLAEQGRMLNRLAALVEKAGLPRDRVLDDAAMANAVSADGGSAETFYYGHNYRAADVARFFALADRDRIALTPEEERLREIARDAGWLSPGATGALVSVPAAGTQSWLDMRARAAMLRHELSHGEFFTNPAYAALVWRFWREMLTEEERLRLRRMLSEASYDHRMEEVMANEAQAFVFHTPDERFFNPAEIGLTSERLAALRAFFLAEMPPGWLRDAMRP